MQGHEYKASQTRGVACHRPTLDLVSRAGWLACRRRFPTRLTVGSGAASDRRALA
jgi:hypothetical protein